MVFGVAERSLVDDAVRIYRDALTHDRTGLPVAFIGAAIGKYDLAKAVWLALGRILVAGYGGGDWNEPERRNASGRS